MSGKPLIQVEDLHVDFHTDDGIVRAVRGVDFEINEGESLGLVGESGCGKSVTALSMMQLVPRPRGRIPKKHIWLWRDGEKIDIVKLNFDSEQMRQIRGGDMSMIFQEPMTSLNPSFTIGFQIMEAIMLHQEVKKKEARDSAIESLRSVKLPDPEEMIDRYPHELSGGMRQRVMIAMAIACNPRLLIADEPTTALDVTIQAQILDLMIQCRERYGMSVLMITHNLGVVGELCDKVAVMYLGQVVEYAPVKNIFEDPKHPYTRGLLSCVPLLGTGVKKDLVPIPGTVPGPFDVPSACAFSPRCSHVCSRREETPPIVRMGDSMVRCWEYAEDQ